MHQRVVQMIVLSAKSENKIKTTLKMELRLNEFWVLTSLLWIENSKIFFFCGQHNEMIWRIWKTELQNEWDIPTNRMCSTQTLHHFLWIWFSSFLCFTLIAMFEFYEKLSSNSLLICFGDCIPSQKTQHWELLPCLETLFLFYLRVCPTGKIQKKKKDAEPRSQENWTVSIQSKKKTF